MSLIRYPKFLVPSCAAGGGHNVALPRHSRFFVSSLLALTGAFAVLGRAQTVDAQDKNAAKAETPILVLSPFVVSTEKDNGYMAADTISSGRLSTSLLMSPSDTSVITRQLLDDLGVFDTAEATGWLTSSRPTELNKIEGNSVNPNTTDNSDSGSTGSFRGMPTQPSTRNYFVSSTTPMEYNVERVEGARGPNAILYGEGGPGGQINYLTKKAGDRDFGTVKVRVDSEGSMGLAVDLNRTFGRKLSVRYNGSWLDKQRWESRAYDNSSGNALSLVFRPYEGMSISVDADKTLTHRSGTVGPILDSQSNWNRVPVQGVYTGTTAQATSAGLVKLGANSSNVYIEGVGVINLNGYVQTSGTNTTLIPGVDRGVPNIPASPPREFNANPDDVHTRSETLDLQAAINQQFKNGLSLELAAASARIDQDGAALRYATSFIDPNRLLPSGAPNPNFGKTYSSNTYGRNIDGSMRDMKAVRLAGNYPFKIFNGVQNVSVIAQRQEVRSRAAVNIERIVNNPSATNPITSNSNLITVFRYWDNLPRSLPNFADIYELRNVPESDSRPEQNTNSIQVGTAGSYLEDRLSLTGGYRYDKTALHTSNGISASRDPITGAMTSYTEKDYETDNSSVAAGIVYFPFNSIGVYANISDGFVVQTNSNPRIDGTFADIGIVPATVKTGGVRLRLLGGKLFASAGYYHAVSTNNFTTVNVAFINNIWRNHPGNEAKVITTFGESVIGSSESITDSQDLEGKGWEGEVTANIANTVRLTANIAFPETKQTKVNQSFRDYVATNLPQWQQWAADGSNAAQQAIDVRSLQQIQQQIDGFQEGRRQNGDYSYRANFFGVYVVKSSIFKRTRLGFGAQFFGPRIIGNITGLPYDYVRAPSYYIFAGSLARSFKVFGRDLDLQLNVANLFDYDDPIYNGLNTLAGQQIYFGYKYVPPREFRLTARFSF